MKKQNRRHLYLPKNFSVLALLGSLILMPSQGMTIISGEGSRNNLLNGPEEYGQIIIEGEVIRVQGEFVGKDFSQMKDQRYLIETPYGGKWDLRLQEQTLVIGDIVLGDYVQAKVGQDGSPQTVKKIVRNDPQKSIVRRNITGKVKKKEGNFLFIKRGDRTEILHIDHQSAIEGDIREGSNIAAQLGEAGYAIRIQESQGKPDK